MLVTIPQSAISGINNNDCAKLVKAGSLVTLTTNGGTCGAGGSSAWSSLTAPSGNLTLAMANNTTAFDYALTTNSVIGLGVTETTAAMGLVIS